MRKAIRLALSLIWAGAVGASPAYANNPPAPDGMLSILLLFPVAILAFRWAGARLTDKERKWRALRWIALFVAAMVTAGGAEIGAMGLMVVLCYGLLRGVQVMRRGQGGKRFAIGSAVILFTLFAGANYLASLNNYPSLERNERSGHFAVRTIVTAENEYRNKAKLDANKNGVPEYGTLEQLYQAGLIDGQLLPSNPEGAYHCTVVLAGESARDEREFFVYATPRHYGAPQRTLSLLDAFRPRRARRTFAADETTLIRAADLGGARPVTREEAQKWQLID